MHHAATACHASAVPPHIMPQLHRHTSCRCCHAAYCHAAATLMLPSHCWVSCHCSHAVVIVPLGVLPSQSCCGHHTAAHCTAGRCYVLCHHSCCCPLHHCVVVPQGATVYGLTITLLHVLLRLLRCCVLPWPLHCRPLHCGLLCHGALLHVVLSQLLPPPYGRTTGRHCVHVASAP